MIQMFLIFSLKVKYVVSATLVTASGINDKIKHIFTKPFFFSKLCVGLQWINCSSSCVEALVILQTQFYVLSSLLIVLKTVILMLS